ncbi:MAG: RNA chaperone Hfq [Defluviitaleaceae bacterium]|nr:RNA chaperone Hfq [Defluviitaleaceae bacterium]
MAQNYQDLILGSARRDNTAVALYLTSGFQIRGYVRAFDNYVIIVESDGKQQMVYKHAVSTIVPSKQVSLTSQAQADS